MISSRRMVELRRKLTEPPPKPLTISEFAEIYMDEYCNVQNTRPEFKEFNVNAIVRILGDIPVNELTREQAHRFRKVRRKEKSVGSDTTVNRGIAVLRNMRTFAINKKPSRQVELAEPQTVLFAMSLQEERQLVQLVLAEDQLAGIYCRFLGETGLRKEEGLRGKWSHLNYQQRLLTVDASKNFEIRHVPLSDYALELLSQVTRVLRSF